MRATMTEIMKSEQAELGDYDIGAEVRALASEVLKIIPEATDEHTLSTLEVEVDNGKSRIVIANKKNPTAYDSDFVVSKMTATPGKALERETYRWASTFSHSRDFQFHETISNDRDLGKPKRTETKGFDRQDIKTIHDLIITANEANGVNG